MTTFLAFEIVHAHPRFTLTIIPTFLVLVPEDFEDLQI